MQDKAVSQSDKSFRYRASYQKLGEMRSLTHLELARQVRIAFARAEIPVSVGGSLPVQCQISFGPALPMNVESRGELVDFFTYQYLSPHQFLGRINETLPEEIHFLQMLPISKTAPSLCAQIDGAEYSVPLSHPDTVAVLSEYVRKHRVAEKDGHRHAILHFRLQGEIFLTKHKSGKVVNIKDFVHDIRQDEPHQLLWIEMKIVNGTTVGIHHLLKALYTMDTELPVCRERLYVTSGGQKRSPLTLEWEQIQWQRHM